jgi:hypothetical protein
MCLNVEKINLKLFKKRRGKMLTRVTLMVGLMMVLGLSGAAKADITSNLLANWDFEEAGGTTAIDTAGGNNGLLMGTAARTAAGTGRNNAGQAISLSGAFPSYVKVAGGVAGASGMSEYTISAWVKLNSVGAYDNVISTGWVGQGTYFCITPGRGMGYGQVEGFVTSPDGVLPSNNKWYMVTQTMSTADYTAHLYVNGVEVANTGGGENPLNVNFATLPVYLGADGKDNYRNINGLMDDVRIYNRALTTGDIAQLYTVPEPMTMVLLGLGSLGLLRRKRA